MKILVTGANGNLGSKIIEFLLQKTTSENIIAGIRDVQSDKAQQYKAQGIEVRRTDFENQASLATAFADVDRVFVVSTFGDLETVVRHQTNAVEAAKTAGVKQIVYPSVTNANSSDFFLAVTHYAREKVLVESGVPFVILRNNWYLENELDTIKGVAAGAPWVTSAADGKIGWVYRPDLAEATANILVTEGHDHKIYELSGENLTQQQFVTLVSNVLNKEVQLLEVDDDAYTNMLKQAGVPESYIYMLVQSQKGMREGALEAAHSDLENVLGRKATPLKEALLKLV